MKRLTFAALLLCLAVPAFAHDDQTQHPALSLARLTVGGRGEYVYWEGKDSAQLPGFKQRREWAAGVSAAYGVVPRFSLTARALYHMDSKLMSYALGFNILIFNGQEYSTRRGNR